MKKLSGRDIPLPAAIRQRIAEQNTSDTQQPAPKPKPALNQNQNLNQNLRFPDQYLGLVQDLKVKMKGPMTLSLNQDLHQSKVKLNQYEQ